MTGMTLVTESIHPTKPAAQLRAKEIDLEVARDTFLDPRLTLDHGAACPAALNSPPRPGPLTCRRRP